MRTSRIWLAVLVLVLGCTKNNQPGGPAAQNLQQYFAGAHQYTLFEKALQRTGLDSVLEGTNPYTVFAVDDSGMTASGYTAAGIDSMPVGSLTATLLYHLVPGSIASTDVQLYQETILNTADSGYKAYLEYNNFGLFYNGVPLVTVDNAFVNGIVQQVQTLNPAPLGNLATAIATIPSLSDFNYYLSFDALAASTYYSAQANAPITVFIPDNNYFRKLGVDDHEAILNAIVTNNNSAALPASFYDFGQYFTSDFVGETSLNLNGAYTLLFTDNGLSFYLVTLQGTQMFTLTQSNIVTTNGIIHIIEPN